MPEDSTGRYPPYLLPRPPMPESPAVRAAFDALYERTLAEGPGREVVYDLPHPRWQFLCHLADTREVVLHGSGDDRIDLFEPRKSDDVNEFGDRTAVYAASDGLWPMYFAILDRQTYRMTLVNSAIAVETGDGGFSAPLYFFSITAEALAQRPFRRGTVYVLPRAQFERQADLVAAGRRVRTAQWASARPVAPLMRLTVGPEDFPLLELIRGHDDETTFARARADPDGFPWLGES